jgi:hypothetical protein
LYAAAVTVRMFSTSEGMGRMAAQEAQTKAKKRERSAESRRNKGMESTTERLLSDSPKNILLSPLQRRASLGRGRG